MNFLRAIGNLLRFDRANWKAVILCFIVAIIFWLFNAFNKTYSTNVRFPLRFEYDIENFVPATELPRQVTVNVSGNGWDLFRSFFGIKLPELTIPIERPLETKKIVGALLRPQLEPQLGKLKVNYVVTDTLHLKLDERDAHLYKVVVDAKSLQFKEGYGLISPIVVLPDSVSLDGSKNLLHELPDSIMLLVTERELSESFSEEMDVSLPQGVNLIRNPPTVKVMFEVGAVKVIAVRLKWIDKKRQISNSDSVGMKVIVPARQVEDFMSISTQFFARGRKTKNAKAYPTQFNLPPYARIVEIDSISNE
jgi:YbbR domain-containing protein